jgi:hypothetical protein
MHSQAVIAPEYDDLCDLDVSMAQWIRNKIASTKNGIVKLTEYQVQNHTKSSLERLKKIIPKVAFTNAGRAKRKNMAKQYLLLFLLLIMTRSVVGFS